MYLPSRSVTLTGILTRVVSTRTTSPSPTSSGPASFDEVDTGFCSLGSRFAPPSTGGRDGRAVCEGSSGCDWDCVCGACCWDDGGGPTRRGRVCACTSAAANEHSRVRAMILFMMKNSCQNVNGGFAGAWKPGDLDAEPKHRFFDALTREEMLRKMPRSCAGYPVSLEREMGRDSKLTK